MTSLKNIFCWVQLQSSHPSKSKSFYSHLFDWYIDEAKHLQHPYIEFDTGDIPGGSIIALPPGKDESSWIPFVQVSEIQEHSQKAHKLGAKILVEPTPLNNGGTYCIFEDPTGAVLGLYEPPNTKES